MRDADTLLDRLTVCRSPDACTCGHPKRHHSTTFGRRCLHIDCGCSAFWPDTNGSAARSPSPGDPT